MFVLSVFCMFLLNSFLFSPQIESVLNVENNTNLINGTTKLDNNIEKIIKTTENEATTTKVDEEGEEQTEAIQKVLQTKETTKITTEDPWDKGVTLSSQNKGIPTSTVILAALCLALLVAICNVYCYGKTRGYI